MDFLESFLTRSYLGNTVMQYLTTVALLTGGFLAVWLVNRLIFARFKIWVEKSRSSWDDFLVNAMHKTLVPLLYFGVFSVSLQGLTLNASLDKLISALGAILLTVLGIRFVVQLIKFFLLGSWSKKHKDESIDRQVRGFMPIITVIVWVGGAVFLLDNLGFKISALVAGLGIGGVAMALASQTILGDLFSYFAIMMDRPFEIGDFIIMGDFMGTVEDIGIKTTRLRSLGGEQLVFSNTDLTSSRVRNYKRMEIRRIQFNFGITYDTPLDKLKALPGLLKEIVMKKDKTRFDRAHFASFGESSLGLEVVYFVLSSDYNVYMDIQQDINFAIKEEFEKRKIEFAFPSRSLYVEKFTNEPATASPKKTGGNNHDEIG